MFLLGHGRCCVSDKPPSEEQSRGVEGHGRLLSAASLPKGKERDEVIGLGVSGPSWVLHYFPCSISFALNETRCRVASTMNAFSKLCEAAYLALPVSTAGYDMSFQEASS